MNILEREAFTLPQPAHLPDLPYNTNLINVPISG